MRRSTTRCFGCLGRLFAPGAFRVQLVLVVMVGAFVSGPVAAQPAVTRLTGTVAAREGGPLANARVVLVDAGLQAMTGLDGGFALAAVPVGPQRVEVSFIGHETHRVTVDLAPGADARIEVLLDVGPVVINGVEVSARAGASPAMQGFYQRRDRGTGHYFTGDEIMTMRAGTLTDILRRVPGATIGNGGGPVGDRQAVGLDRATGISGARTCEAVYYVNGQYFPISGGVGINNFIRPADVDGLEVYSGTSTTPPQFSSGNNTRCGVIVIWTRSSAAGDF